jgi:K(+)-stimulated pyrophosphate-energized sodium pump
MALWLALGSALVAIIYGLLTTTWVLGKPAGSEKMQSIAAAIQEGAKAYMNRQYGTIALVGLALFVVVGLALDWATAIGFAIGAVFSGMAGYIGLFVSVRANVRTAEAAKGGVKPALKLAFRGGAITGMLVVGLGLLGVAGYFAVLRSMGYDEDATLHALVGLAFGGSTRATRP